MFDNVLETIRNYNLIENGDKVIVAVSGGPDSISLLDILYKIKERKIIDFEIAVCHVNHGIRENAKIDEKYVKEYCEKRNILLKVLHANVPEIAQNEKRGLEETGRKIRYDFFEKTLLELGYNKIAIAHNVNDNVETVIMNVIRGSGISGLKGIEPRNGKYIRPLIEQKREYIEKYCEDEKLNPRIDESNQDNKYTRNKIRNIALPFIKNEMNPNIIETITRLSLLARDDLDYLDEETKINFESIKIDKSQFSEEKEDTIVLSQKKFMTLNKAIQKRIILYSIQELFGNTLGIERIHIEDVIKMCNKNIGNKYLTPNKNTRIEIKNKQIVIKRLK